MADEVTLRLFGRFRAEVNGNPVPDEEWHGHRAKAVVKLLALAPNHQLHREQLRESLWPGLTPEAAAANLRKALHYARRALPSTLRVRDAVVSLEGADLWVDVDGFQAAATLGDVRAAADLYTDDLLVEDRYEPWTEEFRTHLRERWRSLLHRQADRLVEERDWDRAAELFDRLLRIDPLDQAAAAGLARAAASNSTGSGASPPSAAVAHEASAHPAASRGTSRPTTAGERKLVTVVLVDAVPDTGERDPEVVARDLARWTSLATEVFGSWDASCDRLFPGALAAVFGVPRLHEDDATRALQASLDLLARSPLAMRVGVATGEAVVSIDPSAVVRGISGGVVGAADRLRETSAVGRVMVAERTCRLVTGFRLGAPVRLGGGGLPECWGRTLLSRVVDWSGDGDRVFGPMVGRDRELSGVVRAFEATVASGAPRFVTVVGAAGMGKSRLVAEAVAALTRSRETTVLQGRCLPAGRGGAYSALGEILCRACGISLADPVATVQTRLRKGLRALFGKDELSEATLAAMAAAIGVAMPGAAPDGVEPRIVAEELSRAWPRFVSAVAGTGPAVVVVEDLHWAGEELLSAMARIAARSRGPLLFLATARPELLDLHRSWVGGLHPGSVIDLAPLDERHSRSLLDQLRPADVLPDATRRRLLARAEGNPFFLQELALHAVHGSAPLPDTISAVLASRLDAVGQADKLVLQYAAVVGRVFWAGPVARAVGSSDVTAALERLAHGGFVVQRPTTSLPGHREYAFRHALTHEVTYASVPLALRARAHAEVAEWLEEAVGPGRNDLAELLGFHWGVASGEPRELAWPDSAARERVRAGAVRWLTRAGNVARARFATDRAVQWHEQALALATTSPEKIEILEALGRDHEAGFHGDEAAGRYRAALSLARADPSLTQDRARLCRRIAWLMATSPGAFSASPDPHLVEELIVEGLRFSGDENARAWLLLVHGISARLWRGSEPFGQGTEPDPLPIQSRVRDAEAALRVGHAQAQPELVRAAERALKILYGLAGRYREATALAYRHAGALASARSRVEQADLLREAAVYAVSVDADFPRGLAFAQRSRGLSAGTDPHQLMHATWPAMVALLHLGRWAELDASAEEHLAAYRALGEGSGCQFVRDGPLIAATARAHRGELTAAQELGAAVGGSWSAADPVSPWQARFELARGDPAAARRLILEGAPGGGLSAPQHVLCLLEALMALEDWPAVQGILPSARTAIAGNALLGPACSRAAAFLAARAGRHAEAVGELSGAIAELDGLGVSFDAARAREELASLLPPESARDVLDAAASAFERLGAVPYLRRLQSDHRYLSGGPVG